jgi:transcriptional regulator with XRE-family HTH domain
MHMSSISKPRIGPESAHRLGQELRRRRLALRMSQTDVGRPFTRAYVSAVESGHCVPSLSALMLLAQRLNTTSGEILGAVKPRLAPLYTDPHATRQNAHSAGN